MTAVVESDEDYDHLPAARERLRDAVHALCGPVVEYHDGRVLTAPSLLEQVRESMFPGRGPEGNYRRAGRRLPLWLDPLELHNEIDVASLCWSRGGSTAERFSALVERTWSVEDCKRIGVMCDALEQWAAQIKELLDPPARWSLPNPCPACGTAVVYRRNSSGESVRTAALQIGPRGCECQNCRTVWQPDRFVWLSPGARLTPRQRPRIGPSHHTSRAVFVSLR